MPITSALMATGSGWQRPMVTIDVPLGRLYESVLFSQWWKLLQSQSRLYPVAGFCKELRGKTPWRVKCSERVLRGAGRSPPHRLIGGVKPRVNCPPGLNGSLLCEIIAAFAEVHRVDGGEGQSESHGDEHIAISI